MTSDGISDDNWGIVRELAVAIFNAGTDEQRARSTSQILAFLDELEARYGSLPSILATRADFVEDAVIKESLLTDGYAIAEGLGDKTNASHIAHSLAALYVDETPDFVKGEKWLGRLRTHLEESHDDRYFRDYERLLKKVELSRGDP
jgi:hypothetical protein